MANKILFVMTGGTIDSYYNGIKDTAEPLEHSCLPEYLKGLKVYDKIEFKEICMKDSRALTKIDVRKITNAIEKAPQKKVIITHGTYTMSDTAKFLKANLKRSDQTIILTGSMIPITGFAPSDGPFNLGYAMAELKTLSPGIYVCMNGRTFSPDEVIKLLNEGRFSSVFGEKKK